MLGGGRAAGGGGSALLWVGRIRGFSPAIPNSPLPAVRGSQLLLKTPGRTIVCGGLCRKIPSGATPSSEPRPSRRLGGGLRELRPVSLLHTRLGIVLGERLRKQLANRPLLVRVADLVAAGPPADPGLGQPLFIV